MLCTYAFCKGCSILHLLPDSGNWPIHLFILLIQGATPLIVACQEGHSDVVNILIRNKADVNVAWKVHCVCVFTDLYILHSPLTGPKAY